MVAYVFSVIGVFRLVRGALSGGDASKATIRTAAWIAALIYAANPNLIYLQSTAMTEPLYLAWFIWAVVYFSEFVTRDDGGSLMKCGLCLAAACLTRYDGWFLAAGMGIAAIFVWFKNSPRRREVRRGVVKFLLLAAAAPILWLAYNAIVYRNPLEFANGPYFSAGDRTEDRGSRISTAPGRGQPQSGR